MRLIEKGFDLVAVNEAGIKEASFIRVPKIHNIHTWFARRPAGLARVLTTAAVLPTEIDEKKFSKEEFEQIVGLDQVKRGKIASSRVIYMSQPHTEKLSHYINPSSIAVLDPMAGGGSIPVEAARLGFRTVAIDYNPVAYLILKATVEFPAKYGEELFDLALREAKDFIEKAKEILGDFYSDECDGYVLARGVKCPHCNGSIPVAGIFPEITKKESFKNRFLKIEFDKENKTFKVETTDEPQKWRLKKVKKKGDVFAECPYCNQLFKLRGRGDDHAFARWFKEHATLMKKIVEDLEPTNGLEEKLLEIHIPLVKQVGNRFYAIYHDEEERKKFVNAFRELSNKIFELQSYIPLDKIPDENQWASTAKSLGLTKWYMLFNPRQLLVLAELAKYIAEKALELYEEKGELGVAAVLYIAFSLDKMADYNTLATHWQGTNFKTGIAHTLRGESTLDFRAEYAEAIPPLKNLPWTLEPEIAEKRKYGKTAGGILPVLRFLTDQYKEKPNNNVKVYQADATQLSKIIDEKIDVINVDPPYYEQVIYSDKSELFWAILRRALMPVLPILFKDSKLENWDYSKPTLPRDEEVVARKGNGDERFNQLFKKFVKETYKVLKDDGYLILWFTHPKAEAWQTVGESLYESKYVVPKVYPLYTEMPTRYKKQVNQVAQQVTLAIVAKKGERKLLTGIRSTDVLESLLINEEFENAVKLAVDDARNMIKDLDITTADAIAIVFSTAMSVVIKYELPFDVNFNELYSPAITLAIKEFFAPLLNKVFSKTGHIRFEEEKASILSEKIEKRLLLDASSRSYLSLWMISHVKMDGSLYDEPLLLSFDFTQMVSKLCGYDKESLSRAGLIKKENSTFRLHYVKDYSTGKIKTDIKTFLKTPVGRAIYLTYLAAITGGTPAVRAKEIAENENLADYLDEIEFDAALALVLIATAPDSDLDGLAKVEVDQLRKIISETLAHLVLGDVQIEVKPKGRILTRLDDFLGG
jgi:adenine-specific DNA methylase